MKNTCYLVVMTFLGLIGSMQRAHCQEQKKPPEGVFNNHASTDYRWDVSLDAFRLKDPPMTPFFTLRYSPNMRGAYRWSITGFNWGGEDSAKSADSAGILTPNAPFELHSRRFTIGTLFGYEIRRNLKKGQLFYGADVWFYWDNGYKNAASWPRTSQQNLGLDPFCGYKYQLTKRFSASVESCMIFSYKWQSVGDKKHGFSSRSRHFNIEPKPISKLNFTFHF